eukprot:TRINITY_DN9852_c0_g1_i1.p1 TRINITY_DN9852_c0_g1~~TRINITY_DN9852_c0_g1_i1.p1  ORF type:complete len:167 (-),score=31.14 TRINITY_DN9852_c0_g1_i1:335-793(-)
MVEGVVDAPTILWTSDQVANFVSRLAPAYEKYRDAFLHNGVDGRTFLGLTDDELLALGIEFSLHRRRILNEIQMQDPKNDKNHSDTHIPHENLADDFDDPDDSVVVEPFIIGSEGQDDIALPFADEGEQSDFSATFLKMIMRLQNLRRKKKH